MSVDRQVETIRDFGFVWLHNVAKSVKRLENRQVHHFMRGLAF